MGEYFLVPFQLINYVKQLKIYLKEIIRAFLISPVKTGCNKFEFVENVCNILGLNPDLKKNTVKSVIRPRYSVLSCKKLKNTINFECDWKTDLKSYLKYNYFEDLKIV